MRKKNYFNVEQEIIRINQSNTTSTVGHNFLSDWTQLELKSIKNIQKPVRSGINTFKVLSDNLPESVNWVEKGVCNPIVDQGRCGSCWAFSSVAQMESAYAIFHGQLYKLSEQQLVSCSTTNEGCRGGTTYKAWNYAIDTPLSTEADYPYTSGKFHITGNCKYVEGTGIVKVLSQTEVEGDIDSIKAAIF